MQTAGLPRATETSLKREPQTGFAALQVQAAGTRTLAIPLRKCTMEIGSFLNRFVKVQSLAASKLRPSDLIVVD